MSDTETSVAEEHAAEVRGGERFAFGENWARFLERLSDSRIARAEESLTAMLGNARLDGVRMLDAGSGSGLFSLAARRMGAESVLSFDFDTSSVGCTAALRERFFPGDPRWTVRQGSVLDEGFVTSLGTFDLVYSWGVLHHTGDMWRALGIIEQVVAPGGRLYIAIYNDKGTMSRIWRVLKRWYNALPERLRLPYVLLTMGSREAAIAAKDTLSGHPARYVRRWTEYESTRGMSRWNDIVDWIGGYPFEVATGQEIIAFYTDRGYVLERSLLVDGPGCSEFVFRRRS